MNKKFTFEIMRRDSFSPRILIRYANSTDAEGDVFDSLEEVQGILNKVLQSDIFISAEIVNNMA